MYFCNPEHEENFTELCFLYPNHKVEDPQYLANIYVAAVPELYKLLKISVELIRTGPLVSLMDYDEEHDILVPSHGGLTGSTTQLLKVGMSLYNGYKCSLDISPSVDYAKVIFQALTIRFKVFEEIK